MTGKMDYEPEIRKEYEGKVKKKAWEKVVNTGFQFNPYYVLWLEEECQKLRDQFRDLKATAGDGHAD